MDAWLNLLNALFWMVVFLRLLHWLRDRRKRPRLPKLTSRTVIPLSLYQQSPSGLLRETAALQRYVHHSRTLGVEPEGASVRGGLKAVAASQPITVPPEVFFKPGEPRTFAEYDAQPAIVNDLGDAITAMKLDGRQSIEPQLFLGPPGMGKTLLGRVTSNEIGKALSREPIYFESTAAELADEERLDTVIRRAHENPGCVLLIDELHDLVGAHTRKMYMLLEEHRFPFKGDAFPAKLNPFTLIGCTTDYGALHAALKRRWVNHHFVKATKKQLLGYVTKRGFPIEPKAAELIVSRTHWSGAPWEAIKLYGLAVTRAKARQSRLVKLSDAQEIIDRHKIDELGLTELDRSVILALLSQSKVVRGEVVHVASEEALCAMAQVDKGGYKLDIKPKLLSRGLLTVRGGQALTPKAVQLYG